MTRRKRWWFLGSLALLVLLLPFAARDPIRRHLSRRQYPHVVVVSLDTLHVSYTGLYNPNIRTTPHLDALGEGGVVFRHAYTRAPITLPSHATLLSGVSPLGHGAMGNGDVVPAEVTTLAEIFRKAGYRTAAFVSLGVLSKTFGLDQGFDLFDDPFTEGETRSYRYAHEVFQSVGDWLGNSYQDPFFIWVHYSDPHEPYVPVGAPPDTRLTLDGEIIGEWNLVGDMTAKLRVPLAPGSHRLIWTSLRGERPDDRPETAIRLELLETDAWAQYAETPLPDTQGVDLRPSWDLDLLNPTDQELEVSLHFRGRLMRPAPSDVLDNYRQEVEYTDRYLGELQSLFRSFGIEEKVLWVVVSDHGEGLFHHGALGHAEFVFEDQLRIVWLVNGPGVPRGKVVDTGAALMVDVAPTLLDLVGLPEPRGMEGVSWVECWGGGQCRGRDEWWAYALRHSKHQLTAIAGYHWPYKWMWRRAGGRRAYRLLGDPWEEKDLLGLPGSERPNEIKILAQQLRRQRQRFRQKLQFPKQPADLEKRLEILRSLGYIDPR